MKRLLLALAFLAPLAGAADLHQQPVGTRGWVKEEDPCKVRSDVHLHRELGENYLNQFDPARNAYVQALVKWAGEAAPPIYSGFTDAKLKPVFPQPPYPTRR